MLIPELIRAVFYRPGRVEVGRPAAPELNDSDPRVNFCRDSPVPVSQADFGIGNEQKS